MQLIARVAGELAGIPLPAEYHRIDYGENTADQPESSHQLRTKSELLSVSVTRSPEKLCRSFCHTTYFTPQSYIHMVRVMSALANGHKLGLFYYSEPQELLRSLELPYIACHGRQLLVLIFEKISTDFLVFFPQLQ